MLIGGDASDHFQVSEKEPILQAANATCQTYLAEIIRIALSEHQSDYILSILLLLDVFDCDLRFT